MSSTGTPSVKQWLCALGLLALQFWPTVVSNATAQTRRVNAPHFAGTVRSSETALFWFGQVGPSQNYADVRLAYTDEEIWIRVNVFDQWLWLDDAQTRTPASLEGWDAVTVVLDRAGTTGSPSSNSYRLVAELSGWRPRTDYQAAYVGTGTGWSYSPGLVFSTETSWRGDALNNSGADRGWIVTFHVPFSSLGLSGPPETSSVWRLGVQVHDRDSVSQPATSDKFWPNTFVRDQPATWGQMAFALRPSDTAQVPAGAETHTIRHGLGGVVVPDAMVGGGATCAEGVDFFNAWGSGNHAHSTTLVVQNQADVADWPCFSKIYVDFPLSGLPAGKSVVSATLTVYQFGGSDPSQALHSLVQVFTVGEPWDETTITWNSAPLAVENVAQNWVEVIPAAGVPWPGAARSWNLSWAVTQAYVAAQPVLRLALYEADGAYHSGKYFSSSDTGDWNAAGRPTLQVTLVDSAGPPGAPTNVRVVPSSP